MEDKDPDSNDEEIKSLSPTFDLISEELLEKWEKILKSNNLIKARTITSDINFDDYNLNYESIQTIQNDSRRTRVRERFNFIDFESVLQKILVYFCKLNDVEYKQGLNEVLGPFLLLKVKIPKLKLSYIYNLFTLFIDYFFSNYYYESELFSFRSSISLVNLLLKYHDPTLYTLFKENNISPEMYAINWLLTTYANKNSLEITYTLWNTMLEENDQLFMHFMVISFLLYHKHKFIETDGSSIPVFFSKNQIATKEMLTEIVKGAREIRKNTPISFRILVRNLEIFKSRTTRVKEMYEKYNPEQILAMPVLAEELLGNMNSKKKIIPCPNDKCDNFFINEEKVNNEVITSNPCEICKIHNFKESLKYIIIDLRNKNDSQIKDSIINEGTLIFINNDLLPQEIINKGNAGEKLAEQIDKLKNSNNKIHVVLMTNDTDDYDEFEYKYQDTEGDSKKNKINNILSNTINKIKKKLDEQMTKKELKAEKYQQIKVQLRQYELIKSILLYLIEQEYPYISYILGGYILGGYKSIHDLCLKYNIPIIKHKANNCYMCMNKSLEENKNDRNEPSYKIINKQRNYNINVVRRYSDNFIRKKSEASIDKNKSNLKDQILEEIPVDKMNEHLTNKNNIIFHCLLVWHNMNDINEKVIIIIYEKSINIYKMNVKKEGIFFDVIEKIENECIKDVKRDKNVFNLYYKKNDKNYDIKIDTFTDNDGEAFYKIINNILNKIKEENNDNEKNNQ